MSIRQPKPKQIRLPFSVPRPKKGADAPARVCGICRRQDSKYTCPRCNVAYCSLACFRDQCSEPFYRTTIMDEIASDPRSELEEKRKMMDMLRRFEAAAAEGDDVAAALAEDDDDDDDELAAALEGVDLDNIDSNELLRLLPQSHRDAFLATLRDPESEQAKELLQTAIEAGEGEEAEAEAEEPSPALLPWWESDALDEEAETASAPLPDDILDIVADITPPPGVGIKSAYNVIALCVAYVHTLLSLRLPSLSSTYVDNSERKHIKAELLALLPFLAPRSTVRYESTREAWGSVWERVAAEEGQTLPPEALIKVLDIVGNMLHPPITLDPPHAALVLADTYRVLSTPKAGADAKKVAFYRAAIGQIGRQEWLRLEREVQRDVEMLRAENYKEEPVRESVQISQEQSRVQPSGAKIELLD